MRCDYVFDENSPTGDGECPYFSDLTPRQVEIVTALVENELAQWDHTDDPDEWMVATIAEMDGLLIAVRAMDASYQDEMDEDGDGDEEDEEKDDLDDAVLKWLRMEFRRDFGIGDEEDGD